MEQVLPLGGFPIEWVFSTKCFSPIEWVSSLNEVVSPFEAFSLNPETKRDGKSRTLLFYSICTLRARGRGNPTENRKST